MYFRIAPGGFLCNKQSQQASNARRGELRTEF